MTDIDLDAEIIIHRMYDVNQDKGPDHLRVRVPLAGHVTREWIRCYQKLARSNEVSARAEERPDRSWIVAQVPAGIARDELLALMDSAHALIAEADAAARQPPETAEAEAIVREWWSGQRAQ